MGTVEVDCRRAVFVISLEVVFKVVDLAVLELVLGVEELVVGVVLALVLVDVAAVTSFVVRVISLTVDVVVGAFDSVVGRFVKVEFSVTSFKQTSEGGITLFNMIWNNKEKCFTNR